MFAQERHNAIRKIVREHQRINFADLQELVGVSPATLRRDLTELQQSGDLIRVHGGVLDPAYARAEISFDDRVERNHSAKSSIGAEAAALIPSGAIVFVDAGSTCLEAGKILLRRSDVRMITNSVALVAAAVHATAPVLCIGGELRKVSGALVGASALGALEMLHADYALIGATGLNEEGCWTTELSEAETKRIFIKRSSRQVILADSTKWNSTNAVRFATWSDIRDWVTDVQPARSMEEWQSHGIQVHWPKNG
ncbi:MAG TPA: DeoR/GlpR family DNA-binding transcription regulator [Chthoniobacterales bacterium]|jgi:DeoR/GlpR family transcriptional regulator of sugar metabolism